MQLVKRHALNTKGRDFVCGDIHGCYDLLIEKLASVKFKYNYDRLFCVGDLIDRGPKSLQCLELINTPWFFSNMGNHEQFLLQNLYPQNDKIVNPDNWYLYGGAWYLKYDAEHPEGLPKKLLERIAALPLIQVVETKNGRCNIVHAEFPMGWSDEYIDKLDNTISIYDLVSLTCGRYRIDSIYSHITIDYCNQADANLSTTYVGHSIVPGVSKIGKYLYIDTGAFKTGNLTFEELI